MADKQVFHSTSSVIEYQSYALIYTWIYHLEGIHPSCKTLYDAIKIRYNGLNIKDFEIKDIK